jgi:hypothetical protein
MATSVTHSSLAVPALESPVADGVSRPFRRRRIDFEAGRALEVLGHAIEYLADEFAHDGSSLSANGGQPHAIQILMAANREIYFSCPEVPSFLERIRTVFHVRSV